MKFKDKLKAIKKISLKNVNLKKISDHVSTVDEIKDQNKLIILNQSIIIKMLKNLENEEENDQETDQEA